MAYFHDFVLMNNDGAQKMEDICRHKANVIATALIITRGADGTQTAAAGECHRDRRRFLQLFLWRPNKLLKRSRLTESALWQRKGVCSLRMSRCIGNGTTSPCFSHLWPEVSLPK